MSIGRLTRRGVALVGLLLPIGGFLIGVRATTAATASLPPLPKSYGFIMDGGHLYLPYLYFHWTDHGGWFTGTRESLEAAGSEGYAMHSYRFTGTQTGQWLNVTYVDGNYMRGTRERLRFVRGVLYVKESQTGVSWWAAGKTASESQWALRAVAFMECYASAYQAGSRTCSNTG